MTLVDAAVDEASGLPAARRRRVPPGVLAPALVLAVFVAMAVFPGLFTSQDPRSCELSQSLAGPSLAHPFGFSVFGCDYYAETIYSARGSLSVAALVVLGTTLIGLVLGSLAGYVGGWVDVLITRATDVWTSIPLLLGGIVVLSALQRRGILPVSLALILFGWPALVRLQRASVLQQSSLDYVTAARALGARPLRILRRHVVPNSIRPLVAYATTFAGLVIGVEATLTFVGAGLQLPTLSWGILLFQAQDRISSAPHLLLPAAFVVTSVISLVLLGRALGRVADPLQR